MTYDHDVVIWDTVGGAYTSESMNKAAGGSEKEVVQLAQGLARLALRVCCYNQTAHRFSEHAEDLDCKGRGGVAWRTINCNEVPSRCRTLIIQRYSTIPDISQIVANRMVVRATDVYGSYYDHLSALNTICVSEWQASKFREAGFGAVSVVPAMLDDDYYELASVPKVKGRFIYASAWMKGLKETIVKWCDLKHRFPKEMEGCELHVTSPGYGKSDTLLPTSAKLLPDLPPRELAKYMATCEGFDFFQAMRIVLPLPVSAVT